nr:MAG TPA: minor structural protein [Caudoviricetes sp.]
MKNIYEILKAFELEIPEDKKESFEKELNSNYKTIKEVDGIKEKLSSAESAKTKLQEDLKNHDADLANVKKELEEAGEDTKKLEDLTEKLKTLQDDYSEQQKKYTKQLDDQKYEFAIKELASGLKFSSNSAKKSFLRDLMDNKLSMKDEEVLGFKDFVDKYKEQDAGAFVVEDDPNKNQKSKPKFADKTRKIDEPEPKNDEPKNRPLVW